MCKELHVIQVNIHPNLGEVNRKLSKNEEQILHTLNTNFGGLARGGNQSSSLRRYTRQVMHIFESLLELKVAFMPEISFSQRDVDRILPHEDDPMVISMQIFEWDIKRVLIDLGSSTNIIYREAFERLQIDLELLWHFKRSLVEFQA